MIINIRSGRCTFANIETGLQNNTVLSAYFDDDNNLWLGLDNGIDMIQVDLPYYSLLGATSRYGAGYVSLRSGDDLYLGTNQGLFVMPYSDSTTPAASASEAACVRTDMGCEGYRRPDICVQRRRTICRRQSLNDAHRWNPRHMVGRGAAAIA